MSKSVRIHAKIKPIDRTSRSNNQVNGFAIGKLHTTIEMKIRSTRIMAVMTATDDIHSFRNSNTLFILITPLIKIIKRRGSRNVCT
jgi:hypothetical protein